jgi:hypothetical protein
MAKQLEKAIQSQGVSLLKSVGGAVYVTGTRRPRGDFQGTCMTPGIPDVLAFLPVARDRMDPDFVSRATLSDRVKARDAGYFFGPCLLFWEAKAPGGRMSGDQQAFQLHCDVAKIAHVVGDLDALIAWLVAHGYCRSESFPHYRQPKAVSA